jgi:hypothetical protein
MIVKESIVTTTKTNAELQDESALKVASEFCENWNLPPEAEDELSAFLQEVFAARATRPTVAGSGPELIESQWGRGLSGLLDLQEGRCDFTLASDPITITILMNRCLLNWLTSNGADTELVHDFMLEKGMGERLEMWFNDNILRLTLYPQPEGLLSCP